MIMSEFQLQKLVTKEMKIEISNVDNRREY